ncbi:MAG TPA: helix-turn-helix domain-containing protein, partial [Edaphobacter sp.]|nr:helix-turn-helix domain-containing protein [Edaphobacter sp.]
NHDRLEGTVMASVTTEHSIGELLREQRERLGLSVRTLAAQAGFSPSFISQVENGLASPSIGSLEKIATCLHVTLSELFHRRDESTTLVIRAKDRPRMESGWSKAEIESLRSDSTTRLEPLLITLRPGGASGRAMHPVNREQFVFVVTGQVRLTLNGAMHLLSKGDAIIIRVLSSILWENISEKPVQLLFVSPST